MDTKKDGSCECQSDGKACDCGEKRTPEQKVDDLKKAIEALGYKTEETEDGIRISE